MNWFQINFPGQLTTFDLICYNNQWFLTAINNTFGTHRVYRLSTNYQSWQDLIISYAGNWKYVEKNSFGTILIGDGVSPSFGGIYSNNNELTWTPFNNFPTNFSPRTVKYCYDKFICLGIGNKGAVSTDGLNWSEITIPDVLPSYDSIAVGIMSNNSRKFIAVGDGSVPSNKYIFSINDGLTWNEGTFPLSLSWNGITYKNNLFFVLGSYSDKGLMSTDGNNWNEFTLPYVGAWKVVDWTPYGGWVAVSYSGPNNTGIPMFYARSINGQDWFLLELPIPQRGHLMASDDNANYMIIPFVGNNGLILTLTDVSSSSSSSSSSNDFSSSSSSSSDDSSSSSSLSSSSSSSLSNITWDPDNLFDFVNCLYPDTPSGITGEYYFADPFRKTTAWPKNFSTSTLLYSRPPNDYCAPQTVCLNFPGYNENNINIPTYPFYKGDGAIVGCPKIKFSKEWHIKGHGSNLTYASRIDPLNPLGQSPYNITWGGAGQGVYFGVGFQEWNQDINISYKITGCVFHKLIVGYGLGGGRLPDSEVRSPDWGLIERDNPYYHYGWNNCNIRKSNEQFLASSLPNPSFFTHNLNGAGWQNETLFESCAVRNIDTSITIKGPNFGLYPPELMYRRRNDRPMFLNYWAIMMPDIWAAREFNLTGPAPYSGEFEITFSNAPDVVIRGLSIGDLNNKPFRFSWGTYAPFQDLTAACTCSGAAGGGLPDISVCPPIINYQWPPKEFESNCQDPKQIALRWCLSGYNLSGLTPIFVSENPDVCTGIGNIARKGECLDCTYIKEASRNQYSLCCPKTDVEGTITGYYKPEELKWLVDPECDDIYFYCPLTAKEMATYLTGFWSGCCTCILPPEEENIDVTSPKYFCTIQKEPGCCGIWTPLCTQEYNECSDENSGLDFADELLNTNFFQDIFNNIY